MEGFNLEMIQTWIMTFGLRLVTAVIILIIGRWLAGFIRRFATKMMVRANTETALVKFLGSLIYYLVLAVAIVAALDQVGVQTASIIALLGAAGLAIGLALQGALGNFAAGVMILFFKPFKLDDFVEISEQTGTVEEIQIFNTVLVTLDNKTVIIPNGQVTNGNIINYSKKGKVRMDMIFGIGYDDDLLQAKQVLEDIIREDDRVFADPVPTVSVMELGDSSVNFTVRPYVKIENYWAVYFDTHEAVKLRFDELGISIPYPQQDVHVFQPQPNLN